MSSPIEQQATSTRKRILADSALVGVALIWGSTFVLIKDVIKQVSPMLFLSARFAAGALALVLVITLLRRWKGFSLRELWWGCLIGISLWAGYALQTIGLQDTTASNGGFITSLYIVFVPILGLFILKQRLEKWSLLGVLLATLGLAMLSLNFEQGIRFNKGDPIVLGCTLAFAMQMVLVARVAKWCDPLRVTMVQVLAAGLLSAISALAFEGSVSGLSLEIWSAALFLGIAATAIAILIQMSVQSFTTAVHTALIFVLEPVFAAIFGIWLQNDRLGPVAVGGAVLIICGMLISELGPQIAPFATGRQRSQTKRAPNYIQTGQPGREIPPRDVS